MHDPIQWVEFMNAPKLNRLKSAIVQLQPGTHFLKRVMLEFANYHYPATTTTTVTASNWPIHQTAEIIHCHCDVLTAS